MDVILLDNIQNLGNLGDAVKVKGGYGRNFLIPQGKAVPATPANIKKFEAQRAELQKKLDAEKAEAQKIADQLAKVQITIESKAGEEGKLFGSIGPREIADAIVAQKVEVTKQHIQMPEGPIRELGTFDVDVQLHPKIKLTLAVTVEAIAE